jgi:FixJ family two-component response regulator
VNARSSVLVLDDDDDLRDALEDVLGVLGRDVVLARSVDDLVRDKDEVLRRRLALLDINLGPGVPSGLDARDWLRSQGFSGKIAFLTGHLRSLPARGNHGARVLEKPVLLE